MRTLGSLSLVLALSACGSPDAAPAADRHTSAPAAVDPRAGDARSSTAATDRVPSGPVVVFFGTSLTAGLGLPSEDDTYVWRAAELATAAGVPFTPVQAGVSGETSAAGLRRIDWVLQNPLDVLVIELGANDGLRGLPVGQLEENLVGVIRRTRERYPYTQIVLLGMEAPPNMGEQYTSAFRQVFQDVAREEGARLVPFLLDGVAGVSDLNQADGIHPTPAGHRRLAENIMPQLVAALAGAAEHATHEAAPTNEGPEG